MSERACLKRIGRFRWLTSLPWLACLCLYLSVALSVGCSRGLPTEYGKSKGRSGNESLNGFGTLRQSYQSNGWTTNDVRTLNDRLRPLDAILWTPATHLVDESEAVLWLQQWLNERPRTLIFVMPDQGSELDYWRQAKSLAPSDQRLEYRRRYARTLARWMTRWVDDTELINRTWFHAKRRRVTSPQWELLAPGESAAPANSSPNAAAAGQLQVGPVASGASRNWPLRAELPDVESWHYQPLVAAPDGTTLLMRITWESSAGNLRVGGDRESRSQILVVAGGSQVNNFALTQPAGRELAQRLLARSEPGSAGEAKRIGFLYSDHSGVPVSDAGDQPPRSPGMELLTVWPLSLVTMHLALMGVVACLILLPIFGRPRRLQERSSSDFADHIQAVAVMLHRSGGEAFARARISDYFRRVRGETVGKWVLPEPPSKPPAQQAEQRPER